MTHRTDRVHLPASEARCEPSRAVKPCENCARRLAMVPPMGSMADYSLALPIFIPWCAYHRAVNYREPPVRKEAKPWPTA